MEDWQQNEQLHFAVQEGNLKRVTALIEDGTDVTVFDELNKTALHYAVEAEHFQIAEYLLENGADINAQNTDNIGETPLSNVGATCSLKMAKFLVKHGAKVDAQGWMKLSAIDRAKGRKKPEGVNVYEFLVSALTRS